MTQNGRAAETPARAGPPGTAASTQNKIAAKTPARAGPPATAASTRGSQVMPFASAPARVTRGMEEPLQTCQGKRLASVPFKPRTLEQVNKNLRITAGPHVSVASLFKTPPARNGTSSARGTSMATPSSINFSSAAGFRARAPLDIVNHERSLQPSQSPPTTIRRPVNSTYKRITPCTEKELPIEVFCWISVS